MQEIEKIGRGKKAMIRQCQECVRDPGGCELLHCVQTILSAKESILTVPTQTYAPHIIVDRIGRGPDCRFLFVSCNKHPEHTFNDGITFSRERPCGTAIVEDYKTGIGIFFQALYRYFFAKET